MDFIANAKEQQQSMLKSIGISAVEELFASIPRALWREPPSGDDGLSECEGLLLMEEFAAKNSYGSYSSYLGCGAYDHYIPAIVGAICSKSEFLTAYTPYQAEGSQGVLQVIFEFQSAICALTGLDVANASLYDGASACGEAALMALRLQKRGCIAVAETLHPNYRAVIEQYIVASGATIITIPADQEGLIDVGTLEGLLDEKCAALIIQSPNVLGLLENSQELFLRAHALGALGILCGNPISYGLFASPSEVGADIAVGDSQPLGLKLNFGGPYAGYIACREAFVRQLPGRIVGTTHDRDGAPGFILTLQAREQHIRREKATSNICTNQALSALASLVAMMWYGPKGLGKLSLANYQRVAYLRNQLSALPNVHIIGGQGHFNEIAISFKRPIDEVYAHFERAMILPGVSLGRWYPKWSNYLLVCATELKSKAQLDHYVQIAGGL